MTAYWSTGHQWKIEWVINLNYYLRFNNRHENKFNNFIYIKSMLLPIGMTKQIYWKCLTMYTWFYSLLYGCYVALLGMLSQNFISPFSFYVCYWIIFKYWIMQLYFYFIFSGIHMSSIICIHHVQHCLWPVCHLQ